MRSDIGVQPIHNNTVRPRIRPSDLFIDPQLYPTSLNFDRRTVTFVQMTPDTYRDTVFLDRRTRHRGGEIQFRVDDLMLAARRVPSRKRAHFILNTAYCCSTLLARCFEILPCCFVLKEPSVLVQAALLMEAGDSRWRLACELAHKLLTRTYYADQVAVIKPYEPCNRLGITLLAANTDATVSFLMTPLRSFILSILKLEERRDWVRARSVTALRDVRGFLPFAAVNPALLSTPQAAACVWMANRYIYRELSSAFGDRVLLVNGDELSRSPGK